MPDHRRIKWDYWCGGKLFAFPLFEARWFGVPRTGHFFLCPFRNGLLFNPSVIEGDKAKRLVVTLDADGHPTVANYVDVVVVGTHDNGLVDICFVQTGRVEHGVHPRQRCPIMTHHVDGEPAYKSAKMIKGLERGRALRLVLCIADTCSWLSFECWRRLPLVGTLSRRRYLRSKYVHGVHKREVHDTFKTYRIRRKEQREWLALWGELDANGDNAMDVGEFCDFFELPFSPLAQRCFELFNEQHNGKISFAEFINGMFDYCVLDDQKCKVFWYRLLTKSGRPLDDDVVVDMRDVRHIVRQFYGERESQTQASMVAITADDDESGGITYAEWLDFSRAHLLLMYPGYWMQRQLRRKCFGERYWAAKTDHRRHNGGFRRNRALERALKQFHRRPVDRESGKRRFKQDFEWGGPRPVTDWGKRRVRGKVLPITAGAEQPRQPPSTRRIAQHVKSWGFW
eukprot:g4319.t1